MNVITVNADSGDYFILNGLNLKRLCQFDSNQNADII